MNALWTALVVACVKLTPLLLFGAKLFFQSVIPLAGMAIFHNRRGLFADDVAEHEDDNNDFENGDESIHKNGYGND